MKRILRTISYIVLVVFVLGFTNCNDELTTRSSTDVEEETILASTTGLNMALRSAYHYLLMGESYSCLLYTSPSPRDTERSRMPSSA